MNELPPSLEAAAGLRRASSPPGRTLRLRARLGALVVALVLPALAAGALLLWQSWAAQRREDTALLRTTVTVLGALVDAEIDRGLVLLRTLAHSREAAAGDLPGFEAEIRAAAAGETIAFLDRSGRTLFVTGQAGGAPAAGPGSEDAREAATRGFAVSDPHPGVAGPALVSTLTVPVRDATGSLAGMLTLDLPAARFQSLVAGTPLPEGWSEAILDRRGRILARRFNPQGTVGTQVSEALLSRSRAQPRGLFSGRSPEGRRMLIAFAHPRLPGWTVLASLPEALFSTQDGLALGELGAIGVALLLAGLAVALVLSRRIAVPVARLARAAAELGREAPLSTSAAGFREADEAMQAMADAQADLLASRGRLAELNASLVTRVAQRTEALALVNDELDAERTRLLLVLGELPFATLVARPDGTLIYANPEARRLLAQPDQPIDAGNPLGCLRQSGEALDRTRHPVARSLAGERIEREVFDLPLGETYRPLELSGGAVRDAAGQPTLLVFAFQDVSDRLQAEEARRRSQRLEAMGQLTGGVAHEFNNLLMAISGCLELLQPMVPASSRGPALIANAGRAVQRGADLTRQLLAFARKQQLRALPTDLNALLRSVEPLIASTVGRSVEIVMALDPATWPALADPAQIELVLLNLAINARDAMPQGGRLVIGTGNLVLGQGRRHEDPEAGEYAVLRLTDDGCGMSPETAARAFEPFFTTKAVGKGSGLGLPQVLGVAQELGGGARIDSRLGQGTTVSLFLPRAASPGVELGESERPAASVSLAGLRILVVDDDRDVREVAAAMLDRLGARVETAASGDEAMLRLRTGLACDAALVDRTMPGLSGAELAGEMAAVDPRLPILLMTGYTALPSETPAVHRVLSKPFRADTLAKALLAAIRREPPPAT